MRACIIDHDGICVNVIEVGLEDPKFLPRMTRFAPDHTGSIGMAFKDGQWVEATEVPKRVYKDGRLQLQKEEVPEVDVEQERVKAEAAVRSHREALLSASDWIVVFHTEKGTNTPLEWEVYRQALRDITAQEGFPHEVIWPVKP